MPRKPRLSGVRGPNLALTEFLRNEGITDAFRERQNRQRLQTPDANSSPPHNLTSATPAVEEIPDRENEDEDEDEEVMIRAAGRRKRRAARSRNAPGDPGFSDSGDDDSDFDVLENADSDDDLGGDGFKKFGEEDLCVDCGNPFTLTVYLRYVQTQAGYLCDDCNEQLKQKEKAQRRNELNARKKRKKLAQALLDKKTVRIPSLQDVCIKEITQNIDDVEILGDIGQSNINKILRILSKNRSLNDNTVSLFLNADLKELELWDCSNVSSHLFDKVAAYCLNLEALTLFMCGQFHNDNLEYYKDKLPGLKRLSLNGPFLISPPRWKDFFDNALCQLEEFEIRNTHRFEQSALAALLEKRGQNLTSLKLLRLDGLAQAEDYELIASAVTPGTLTSLEISYPHKDELISDSLMVHILAVAGESIRHLNVDGCSALTDAFLIEGVAKFCPSLETLSMKNLDLVTDEGFEAAIKELSEFGAGGLTQVDLTKCIGLGDKAINALLNYTGLTLVELSLNSLDKLSRLFFLQVAVSDEDKTKRAIKQAIEDGVNDNVEEEAQKKVYYPKVSLPLLTRLDVGFVRNFDDEAASKFSEEYSRLNILEVYGNNRLTSKAQVRPNLLVIGRQGDTI